MARHILSFILVGMLTFLVACSSIGPSAAKDAMQPSAAISEPSAVEIQVFAAAALTEALKEIQPLFQNEHTGIKVAFTFASTPALLKQLEQGAAANLFIGETELSMRTLIDGDYVDETGHYTLLRDELVVVGLAKRKDAIASMADLSGSSVNRIAIGEPANLPVGLYTKEALIHELLWDKLTTKIVEAKDSKQVLQYVETGNVDAGFVYKSTASSSSKVVTLFSVDPQIYSSIVYPIGQLKTASHSSEAALLYEFLRSEPAQQVFKKYSFTAPEPDA